MTPIPSRSGRPPAVWGALRVEGDEVVARFSGWRRLVAAKGRLAVPISSVTRVEHDPAARAHISTGLRRRSRHGFGVFRVGAYHGTDGWSFWSIGVGRNAVVVECSGARYRYVVVEVADPVVTVRELRSVCARAGGAEVAGTARGIGGRGIPGEAAGAERSERARQGTPGGKGPETKSD